MDLREEVKGMGEKIFLPTLGRSTEVLADGSVLVRPTPGAGAGWQAVDTVTDEVIETLETRYAARVAALGYSMRSRESAALMGLTGDEEMPL